MRTTPHTVRSMVACWGLLAAAWSPAVEIATSSVGDAGNANDGTGLGGVAYVFSIGQYEVTISQYTEFLNAVAASDPHALYNTSMGSDANISGILRSGSSGSYSYSVVGASGNNPITWVSWLDAARFTNWLHNGQGNGGTETGAYTIVGTTIVPRNSGAIYWIPNRDEWYKAAYFDPTASGTGNYWAYPTRSDSVPGNTLGADPNQANFLDGEYAVTGSPTFSASQNYLTSVGTFTGSASYYNTYDQGGNVYEWTEAGTQRGGSWSSAGNTMIATFEIPVLPATEENANTGFRVAAVPEPSSALLIGTGVLLFLRRNRRAC